MIRKWILFCFLISPALAAPCDEYAKDIDVNVKKSEWKININKSDDDLWPRAGYVKIMPFYNIVPKISYAFNGKYYCVFLESVVSVFGFKDFDIFIDKKYDKDSCEYNAVLEHENHHINDAVSTFNTIFPEFQKILQDAVHDIKPIYAENVDDVPKAVQNISNQIVENKKLQKLVQDFKDKQDKDAEILDSTPDEKLKKCTVDKVNDALEKFFKNEK